MVSSRRANASCTHKTESQRDRARPVARFDESVFDIPATARQMGWDEHELMYNVFEFGEEEGMRWMSSSPSLRSGRLAPEPVKSVQILFRGEHGLGVQNLAADQSLAHWYSGGYWTGGWMGTLPWLEGRSLTRR